MKKIILAAAFALAVSSAQAAYKDGTYTGTGMGNASQIEVSVTVKDGKVDAVKVIKHGETEMLINAAEKKLAKRIVKKNTTDGIDVVSGASNSSKGILAAVKEALAKAQ